MVEFIPRFHHDLNKFWFFFPIICLEFRCVQAQPLGIHSGQRRALKLCYTIPSPSQLTPRCAPGSAALRCLLALTHSLATSSHQVWHCSRPALLTSPNSTSKKPASVEKWLPTSINTSVLPRNSCTCVCLLIHFREHLLCARQWARHSL